MQKSKRDVKQTLRNSSLVPNSEAVLPGGTGESGTVHALKVEGTSERINTRKKRVIPYFQRVPVLALDGEPLMPAKASRARRWIEQGKAKPIKTKLGLFAVELLSEPSGREKQTIAVGIDPGSSYTGMAVASKGGIFYGCNLELPTHIKSRMEKRRELRRNRRYRKCRRRKCRFLNRTSKKIAPSILAKKKFELRIVKELEKIYPITHIVIEDVKFNHYKKRSGKYFSMVEVGKNWLISQLEKIAPITLIKGHENMVRRKELGLRKTRLKNKRKASAHVHDAISLCTFIEGITLTKFKFDVLRRPKYSRRKLHLEQPAKGGIRRKYGGSTTPFVFRKGDYVKATQGKRTVKGWVSGYTKEQISVSGFDWNRLGRFTLSKTSLLERNPGFLIESKGVNAAAPHQRMRCPLVA